MYTVLPGIFNRNLKVFLAHAGLDKPFTGGIGSYKLYVMVAYLLQQQKDQVMAMHKSTTSLHSSTSTSTSSSSSSVSMKEKSNEKKKNEEKMGSVLGADLDLDLGYLLVAFLHHFGNPRNLNSSTVVRVKLKAVSAQSVDGNYQGSV